MYLPKGKYCEYPRMVYTVRLVIVMPPLPHFGWSKTTFDRISRHFRSIYIFLLNVFTKWLPAAILDDRKSLSIVFLAISDQYTTLIFFFTKWLPAAILDDRISLSIAFLAISDQYATLIFFFTKWLPAAILEVRFGQFWMTENHFRSYFSPFQINLFLNGRRWPFWKCYQWLCQICSWSVNVWQS